MLFLKSYFVPFRQAAICWRRRDGSRFSYGEKEGFVRRDVTVKSGKASFDVTLRGVFGRVIGLTLCVAIGVASALEGARGTGFPAREPDFRVGLEASEGRVAVPDAGVDLKSVVNPVFYDRKLMVNQYGIGVVSGLVLGALGFYIGNAFEGAIFGSNSHKGYLSFTGIRYRHKRGPFWGGGAGLYAGSSLAVFFVGDMDEEQGSVWWTFAGGAVTTVAAFALADMAGVQEKRGMLPFVPLLALPPLGAVGGYHVSRWFNDKKRHRITEGQAALVPSGAVWHAPRLGFAPTDGGTAFRLDALNLTF